MKYPRSVATTWLTSFERLSSDGQGLLRVLCWLSSDPIPLTLVEKLTSQNDEFAIEVRKARRDLVRYSFVKWTDDSHQAFNVHRLVQEITQYRLSDVERKPWLQRALRMVNDFIPDEPDCYDTRSWPEIYLPGESHFAAVVTAADALEITAPTTRIMSCIAGFLKSRAAYEEAEPLMRRALSIDERSYGTEHPDVAIDLNNLASLLTATNRLSDAEPLMRRALAIDEQSYGPEHPKVAIHLNNLASLLKVANRHLEAEPLMQRALAIDRRSFGPEHPKVAIRLNNLAQLLQATNRLSEAEPLMRCALAIDEQAYGMNHPNVARDLNNLAQLLKATNRRSEAEPLMASAFLIFHRSLGETHPNSQIVRKNYLSLVYEMGLSEEEALAKIQAKLRGDAQ